MLHGGHAALGLCKELRLLSTPRSSCCICSRQQDLPHQADKGCSATMLMVTTCTALTSRHHLIQTRGQRIWPCQVCVVLLLLLFDGLYQSRTQALVQLHEIRRAWWHEGVTIACRKSQRSVPPTGSSD